MAGITERAIIACRTAAIDVRFVLILDTVIARGDRATLFRSPVTIHRRAIGVLCTNLTESARIALHTAAIDVRFVLVLGAVGACGQRGALFRGPVTIHRSAIAILRADLADAARIALGTTAIDVRFVLILRAVRAGCGCDAFRRIRIAHAARAIAVHCACLAIVACWARAAAAIDIRFCAIDLPVIAGRSGFAGLAGRITRIAGAIGIDAAGFAHIAFVAFRAATIDVRFILILGSVAACRHSRIRARNRGDAVVANLAVRGTIEQRDPLSTAIHVRCTALNGRATALRCTNRRTAMIACVAPNALAPRTSRAARSTLARCGASTSIITSGS